MGPHGSRAIAMAKDNGGPSGRLQLFQEVFKTEIYKRSQGRIVRQITCLAIWVAFALGSWQLHQYMKVVLTTLPLWAIYGVPSVLLLIGLWIGFRAVNLPSFADFLIAVEAEMNKVSWPTRTELIRSSMVVIILMFGLTMVLFAYDNILYYLLKYLLKVV
jgi:preprotein translocase subunit SecE